jgi:hypothetical protein
MKFILMMYKYKSKSNDADSANRWLRDVIAAAP